MSPILNKTGIFRKIIIKVIRKSFLKESWKHFMITLIIEMCQAAKNINSVLDFAYFSLTHWKQKEFL